MKCPENCPVLAGVNDKIAEMQTNIAHLEHERQNNDANAAQNQATARQLAGLPLTPDVAEARSSLQDAVVLLGEAQTELDEAIRLSQAAIEANQTAGDIVFGNCTGEPHYVDDPSKPGTMILRCVSPGVYAE